ncbi:MAG: hypothetical protein R6V83_03605 [Candidatus Thorarchaeota archaeon]
MKIGGLIRRLELLLLAILNLVIPFVPWFGFSGDIVHVAVEEPYPVTGEIYGFGVGQLDRWSGQVTMWSNDTQFNSTYSDFWFGILPIVSGLLLVILGVGYHRIRTRRIRQAMIILAIVFSVSAFVVAMLYVPRVLIIQAQIPDLAIDADFMFRNEFTIGLGLGPFMSLFSAIFCILFLGTLAQEDDKSESAESH